MTMQSEKTIQLTEVCLRDGSHVVAHQFTEEQVRNVSRSSG